MFHTASYLQKKKANSMGWGQSRPCRRRPRRCRGPWLSLSQRNGGVCDSVNRVDMVYSSLQRVVSLTGMIMPSRVCKACFREKQNLGKLPGVSHKYGMDGTICDKHLPKRGKVAGRDRAPRGRGRAVRRSLLAAAVTEPSAARGGVRRLNGVVFDVAHWNALSQSLALHIHVVLLCVRPRPLLGAAIAKRTRPRQLRRRGGQGGSLWPVPTSRPYRLRVTFMSYWSFPEWLTIRPYSFLVVCDFSFEVVALFVRARSA